MIYLPHRDVDNSLQARGRRAGADVGDAQVQSASIASGDGVSGIWECTPGGWPVVNRNNTEVCYVLSGAGTVFDDETQTLTHLSPGDTLILPAGWTGRWEITETMRKFFVTY